MNKDRRLVKVSMKGRCDGRSVKSAVGSIKGECSL